MNLQTLSKRCYKIQGILHQVKEIKVSQRKSQEHSLKTKARERAKASQDNNQRLMKIIPRTIYLKAVNVSLDRILISSQNSQNRRVNQEALYRAIRKLNIKIVFYKLWLVRLSRKQKVFKNNLKIKLSQTTKTLKIRLENCSERNLTLEMIY